MDHTYFKSYTQRDTFVLTQNESNVLTKTQKDMEMKRIDLFEVNFAMNRLRTVIPINSMVSRV